LRPGDFVNLNRPKFPGHRSNNSGHAVLFLSYVGDGGKDTTNADQAAGFRYFSNQNSTNGFGEKIAFFLKKNNTQWYCPEVANASTDCGVMFSNDDRYLNAGRLLAPELWNPKTRDDYIASVKRLLYDEANSKGLSYFGLDPNLTEPEFSKAVDSLPDVMELGPDYAATDF
jgi:hypothetical protein